MLPEAKRILRFFQIYLRQIEEAAAKSVVLLCKTNNNPSIFHYTKVQLTPL